MRTQEKSRHGRLNLDLSLRPPSHSPPQPVDNETSNNQQQQEEEEEEEEAEEEEERMEQPRQRRRRTRADTRRMEPPYPWSTDRRAVIHKLEYLQANNIVTIKGEVKCKKCERKYEMEYELMNKFYEITRFIESEKNSMHDRAPSCWANPILPNCNFCNKEKCVEPVIISQEEGDDDDDDDEFSRINWLFLLLGRFLGCLKLKQLRYFCAQNNIHRTGAKNRLLYLVYLALCQQLQPSNIHFL